MLGRSIRTVVADGHPLYLRGVRQAFEGHPQIELVGEAADGDAALALIRDRQPDVALLDLMMPGRDGLQILRELSDQGFPARVVLISAHADERLVYEALAAGAHGYLSKQADDEEVCGAIVAAADGETTVSPQLQRLLFARIREHADPESSPVSPREHEILALVARGQHRAQIGHVLHLSPATVKTYLSRAYEKLGVPDRAAATAEAVRRGWLE